MSILLQSAAVSVLMYITHSIGFPVVQDAKKLQYEENMTKYYMKSISIHLFCAYTSFSGTVNHYMWLRS